MSEAQPKTLRPATLRRMARMRSRRSSASMSMARVMAAANPSTSYGLMMSASRNSSRRAGERAQHQHAVLVVSRRDELFRDEIHPVVQRADDAEIGHAVERDELGRPSACL